MKLLSSQKANVRVIIQTIGLPDEEFCWEDEELPQGVCLRHKPTDSYFRLQHQTGDIFDCYKSPGDTGDIEHFPRKRWMEIEKLIERWMHHVDRERRAAIGWDQLKVSGKRFPAESLLADPDFYDDKPFSHEEIDQIHQRLEEFEAQVKKLFYLTETQALILSEEIRFSKQAAKVHGRRTWKRIFEGMILGFDFQISSELGRAALKWGLPWIYRFLARNSEVSLKFLVLGNLF